MACIIPLLAQVQGADVSECAHLRATPGDDSQLYSCQYTQDLLYSTAVNRHNETQLMLLLNIVKFFVGLPFLTAVKEDTTFWDVGL
jgi:hypothetical protein